jgi:uncharacterized membrane protein
METKHRFGLAAAFVVVAGVVSVLFWSEVPEQMATHWNAAGEVDERMGKTVGLALIPGLSAVLLAMFAVLPRIDPLGENIAAFRATYDWFVVVFTAYMTALHAGIVAFNLGYEFDFILLVVAGVAALFWVVGVVLERAERNWFVGIQTPWTLSSDEVWRRTHELGARLFKLCAVLALVGAVVSEYAIYFLVGPAIATAVVTFVYSYVIYERLDESGDLRAGD